MKKQKILIIIILIVFFLKNNYKNTKTGNNISNKSADEIKEYILNIQSYETTASIKIISNKNENNYVVKQKYNGDGNLYKQEILEPENIKGIQFIYDGTNLKIENTKLNLNKIYENYNYIGSNELSIISFIEEYKQDNNSKCNENDEFIILETNVENENKYTSSKKLYINKEEGKIEKMEINDRTKSTRIYILYNEIELNTLPKKEIVAFSIRTIDEAI